MMFGLGGTLVEVLRDVVFSSLPIGKADAAAMLDEIKAKQVLSGVRGARPMDKRALIHLMCSVSDLCTAFPEISELDLNPVMALPEGIAVLDARILLGPWAA
jgi:acetate---CoA ligase (ADP-forming)